MNADFLTELSQLPTGIFTVLMGLVVLYWLLFLVGSLDLDFLGGADGIDGALDGATEGAVEGAIEGATEGAAEAAAEAAAEGAAEAAAEGAAEASAEGAVGLLHALKLRSVPVTISISFVVFFAWILSYISMRFLGPVLPELVVKLGTFVVAGVGGVFCASLAIRPFAKLFTDHGATRQAHLIGRVVTISTGRVDARFGQATCDTGAANLILEVRAKAGSEGAKLKRGDQALIIDYDEDTRVFVVEPTDPFLELRGK